MIVFRILFVLIPDIRQAFGADVSTRDFVLSQGSGNAALCIWIFVNAVRAFCRPEPTENAEERTGITQE